MEGGPPTFRQDFTCPALLEDDVYLTCTGLSPAMARLSRRFQLLPHHHWPGPRSLATTSGVSVDVLSSGYLDVSVPRVRLATLWIQVTIPLRVGFPIRKCPDQSLLAAPRTLSQRATSFIASQCQGIHQMPFLTLDRRLLQRHAQGQNRSACADRLKPLPGFTLTAIKDAFAIRTIHPGFRDCARTPGRSLSDHPRSQTLFTMSKNPPDNKTGPDFRSGLFCKKPALEPLLWSPGRAHRRPGRRQNRCGDLSDPVVTATHQRTGGGERDRTDDLMLAKHALSQLSYAPGWSLTVPPPTGGGWWAREDLNLRPHAYQARALTN